MITKAFDKINSEMDSNKNNPYIQAVGGFLLLELDEHPDEAEKILQDGKTIAKSLDEMRKAAEKKKVGNCAVLTDQEGFEIVLKYFGIDAKALKSKPVVHVSYKVPKPSEKKSNDLFDIKLENLL